jgi:hypothetical protein
MSMPGSKILQFVMYVLVVNCTCCFSSRHSNHAAPRFQLVHKIQIAFSEAYELCLRFPVAQQDTAQLYGYLHLFVRRIATLGVGDLVVSPAGWYMQPASLETDQRDHAVCVVVLRTDSGYIVSVINLGHGVEHHPITCSPEDGSFQRNVALTFRGIPVERAANTVFWQCLFRMLAFPSKKVTAKKLYERLLPFLTQQPVNAIADPAAIDWRPLPTAGDYSMIGLVAETAFHIGRLYGLTPRQSEHVPLLLQWELTKFTQNDLEAIARTAGRRSLWRHISSAETDVISICLRSVSKLASAQSQPASGTTHAQIKEIFDLVGGIQELLDAIEASAETIPPRLTLVQAQSEVKVHAHYFELFGRLRRDTSVEHLAGAAVVPPIVRPVELTLVPDKISTYNDATTAMRHAVNLCSLLANQRDHMKHTYTLRACLVQHLFFKVIPIPIPLNRPDRMSR